MMIERWTNKHSSRAWYVVFNTQILKGSYDAISSFAFYLEQSQADCAKIRSLKLQRLKSQNQRDILYQS